MGTIRDIYRRLARSCGPQHWWPAETPFEVIVGAILTQNTSWTNVEKALAKLRAAGRLTVEGIRHTPVSDLEQLVRSAGYFRQKTERLKTFVRFLDEKYAGSLDKMFATPTQELREQLLSLKGIGRETADSILLYAGNHEIFVVDAYTRRILGRHGAVARDADYDEIRVLVERALPQKLPTTITQDATPLFETHEPSAMSRSHRSNRAQTFNEMHGLFVQVGKSYCHRKEAKCFECPLEQLLPPGGPAKLE